MSELNKRQQKRALWTLAISFIVVSIAVIQFLNTMETVQGQGSRWDSAVFEDVIVLDYSPRDPRNMEPVNVTIESKDYEPINVAYLNIDYSTPDGQTGSGGYEFNRLNASRMYRRIQGYPGGTSVDFQVEAYDTGNNMVRSPKFTYVVAKNGSWKSNSFEENINLTYVPTQPDADDNVEVIIQSRYPDVNIDSAYLYYQIEYQGITPEPGVVPFNRISDTKMNATIVPYPGGSNVTFWITARDTYQSELTSKEYMYSIPAPAPEEPDYVGSIMIVVQDVANLELQEKALVIIKNNTWSNTTNTSDQGIALIPKVYKGEYEIEVYYLGEKYTQNVRVPNPRNDYTIEFEVNEKATPVEYEMEGAISLEFLAGIILAVILFFLALRYKKDLLRLISKDKEIMKGKEKETEEKSVAAYLLTSAERRKTIGTFTAFAFLGLFGSLWSPFFPWWMVIIITLVTGAIAIKSKYLSMIVLTVFSIGATGFQAPEFGLLFAIFSFIILIITLFSLEFGYLTFSTIYLSRFGLSLLPITLAAVLYPLALVIGTLAVSYAFIYLVIYNSNIYHLGGIFAPAREEFIATFSRDIPESFGLSTLYDSINSTSFVNLNRMGGIMHANLDTPAPILFIIAISVVVYLFHRKIKEAMSSIDEKKRISTFLSSREMIKLTAMLGLILGILSVASGAVFDVPMLMLVVGIEFPLAMILGLVIADNIRLTYPEIYIFKEKVEAVGKSMKEVEGLRKTTFDLVGGLDDVKEEIKEAVIIPLLKPKIAKKYGVTPSKGVLLFGPPGCGKTLLMRAIASELNVDMIYVKCSDVMSKWYGESENTIDRLFRDARNKKPCIVFLDEIDAITKRRDFYSTDDVTPRILSIILAELDGMEDAEGIIFVGSTNMPDIIDPAIMRPGRFDKIIYVPPPDRRSRIEVLKIHTENRPLSKRVDLNVLATKTKGYSGADIENLVKDAAVIAMRERMDSGRNIRISMRHFKMALRNAKPSITSDMVEAYKKLKKGYERKKDRRTMKREDRSSAKKAQPVDEEGDIEREWEMEEDTLGEGEIAAPEGELFSPEEMPEDEEDELGEEEMSPLEEEGEEMTAGEELGEGGLGEEDVEEIAPVEEEESIEYETVTPEEEFKEGKKSDEEIERELFEEEVEEVEEDESELFTFKEDE